MSAIGLNSNTYRVTGKYLDFLNDFLAKAKVHSGNLNTKKDQLVDFLAKLYDVNSIDPQMQLLSSIIERELRPLQERLIPYFERLIAEVQADELDKSIPKIEFLVEALDAENSEALAKIKGE